MQFHRHFVIGAGLALTVALAGCGGAPVATGASTGAAAAAGDPQQSRFRDLFTRGDQASATIKVNKYIWNASLEVLNFLPVEQIDPFTGVIVTGYGKPPGGGRAYRATILVQDPALDARSLKLAMQAQGGGAVDPATLRAVEDAILTRAREMRIADGKL
jgi:hypothetical protein